MPFSKTISLLLAAATMVALLLLWRSLYTAPCAALAVPFLAFLSLFRGLRESAVTRRRLMATIWLEPDAPLYPWFTRTFFLTVRALLVAAFLAAALFMAALTWSKFEWWLLASDAAVIVGLYTLLRRWLERGGARSAVISVLSRRWTTAINVPILLTIMLMLQLDSPPPDYIFNRSLSQAVAAAASSAGSECGWVNAPAKLQLEKDALSWWLMVRGSEQIGNASIRWLAWLLFLSSGGVTWWGFSRLTVESVDYVDRLWDVKSEKRADE